MGRMIMLDMFIETSISLIGKLRSFQYNKLQ